MAVYVLADEITHGTVVVVISGKCIHPGITRGTGISGADGIDDHDIRQIKERILIVLHLNRKAVRVAGFISINAPRPQTAYMEVHAAGPGASVVCKCYRPVLRILHTVKGICREEYFTVLPSCCQKHGSCLCGIGDLLTLDNSRVLCRDDMVRPGAFVLRVTDLRITILRVCAGYFAVLCSVFLFPAILFLCRAVRIRSFFLQRFIDQVSCF